MTGTVCLNGAIYGISSHGLFQGSLQACEQVQLNWKGLYLAGGAAHPGPGMPMVMMSGWIAADTLDQDGTGVWACGCGQHRVRFLHAL